MNKYQFRISNLKFPIDTLVVFEICSIGLFPTERSGRG